MTKKPLPLDDPRLAPAAITWWQIAPASDDQYERSGLIWSEAPKPKGAREAHYVLPSAPLPGEPPAIVVVTVSARHRVGRVLNGRWSPTGGRYVDKGERYTETHPRSLTRLAATVPIVPASERTVVRSPRIPPNEIGFFMRYGGGPPGDIFPGLFPDEIGADPNPPIPTWYEYEALLHERRTGVRF